MWDYSQIPKKRAALEALSEQERAALTWETAAKYLRSDTVAMAVWSGMFSRKDLTPFEAVWRANFGDAIPPTTAIPSA